MRRPGPCARPPGRWPPGRLPPGSSSRPREMTRLPSLRPMAISESVPYAPAMAMSAWAVAAMTTFLAWPMPVTTGMSMKALAERASYEGRTPTVRPPALFAPRAAASMTPPRPPQTRTAPARAISAPASSARAAVSGAGSESPMTPMMVRIRNNPGAGYFFDFSGRARLVKWRRSPPLEGAQSGSASKRDPAHPGLSLFPNLEHSPE